MTGSEIGVQCGRRSRHVPRDTASTATSVSGGHIKQRGGIRHAPCAAAERYAGTVVSAARGAWLVHCCVRQRKRRCGYMDGSSLWCGLREGGVLAVDGTSVGSVEVIYSYSIVVHTRITFRVVARVGRCLVVCLVRWDFYVPRCCIRAMRK
ncbi:hypothetical protein DENSPDRAFT_698303 [Dentipellis sp. KUC8613]|nr:hypothetical protein DENSPDRAFT_698303 [Dentipellis sp. KUC8613]